MAINLQSFADGRQRLLSGVWFFVGSPNHPHRVSYEFEHAQHCFFMLDGRIYRAVEDPEDGYRSSLAYVEEVNALPVNVWNPPEPVIGKWYVGDEYAEAKILELHSTITEKKVLLLGTSNTDDYYPSCVMSFYPEALSHNQQLIDILEVGVGHADDAG